MALPHLWLICRRLCRETQMAIKEILIVLPTYPDAPPVQTIKSACFLAQTLEAKITGLIPQLSEDVATWPALIGTFPLDFPRLMDEAVRDSERNAHRLTEDIAKVASEYHVGLDIRRSLTVLYGPPEPLVDLARLHDLTILPIPEIDSFDRSYLEPVIFGSGHPTLLLPSGKNHRPLRELKNVLVAWDFGREAARALSDAIPILTKAGRVHIFSVLGEKHMRATSGAGDLEKYLGSHGIRYVLEDGTIAEGTVGECLMAQIAKTNADMLVMGAYGHSRFREFVLGGATRGMLAKPTIPIFLSH
jgi:nucleotide-binding universal stress UspA family protein